VALQFKLLGVRFVFDHHDINPELYEAKYGRRDLFWRLMLLFERLTFMTADVVISTNGSYRQIALERGRKRPEDVFIVRSGPNPNRLVRRPPNPTYKKGRAYLVGYVGVMGEQEGIDLLLEAAHFLIFTKGRNDIQFCLIGGGPSLEAMRSLANKMGLTEHVDFLGRVPDEVLFDVLSTSDVCVNPDRVNEMNDKSTMNKILEYMAFEKPIVQFNVTEGRASAGESSLYAAANDAEDFAEKIAELLDSPRERMRRGKIGRERIANFLSWQHEAPKLIVAYQRVAEAREPRQ
jgi:glycosyltransferase involved in cell wall biosynthesis